MTSVATAPYVLRGWEMVYVEAARVERDQRRYDNQGYAFGHRQGLIHALGLIIRRAAESCPLRMNDSMYDTLATAQSLADCKTRDQLCGWLASHNVVPAANVPNIWDVEYAAGAGSAAACLLHLVQVVEALTCG